MVCISGLSFVGGIDQLTCFYRFTRAVGSFLGLTLNYFWGWYFWPEAHGYFINPFAIFLWATGLLCDLLYPFVLWQVRKTEIVLEDGTKVARYNQHHENKKQKPQ